MNRLPRMKTCITTTITKPNPASRSEEETKSHNHLICIASLNKPKIIIQSPRRHQNTRQVSFQTVLLRIYSKRHSIIRKSKEIYSKVHHLEWLAILNPKSIHVANAANQFTHQQATSVSTVPSKEINNHIRQLICQQQLVVE